MMKAFKAAADQQGLDTIEGDGQMSSPKQTADIEAALAKGVKGVVLSPNEVDAMAPALQEAIDAHVPVVTVDRRVPSVTGIIGHVGADNVKGGEAQGDLIEKMFPNGATIINLQGHAWARALRSTATRACTTCSTRPRTSTRSCSSRPPISSATRAFRSPRARSRAWRPPPQVIVAGNDDMALGALEAVKARNLKGIVIIGFDALPETLGKIRDGEITATIEQFPAKQSATAVQHPGQLPQDAARNRRSRSLADAGGDHQGQPQGGGTPRRGEVGSRQHPDGAPFSARHLPSSS